MRPERAGPASLLVLAAAAALALPAPVRAQDAHARSDGFVWRTHVAEARDGGLVLANGAVVEPATSIGPVADRAAAVLVFLRSGCRVWIERAGLHRCRALVAPATDAERTPAQLVWIERIADDGALVLLSGGYALDVPRQSAVVRGWRTGEALLIAGSRLLPIEGSQELVEVQAR